MDGAVVDGRHAAWYSGGAPIDPGLPLVVLVHGAGNDHTVFRFVTRRLAHSGCGVMAVDLPGHGRSAGPAGDSIESMAEWLLRLVELVGAHRAVLAGHSMGSYVALEAAVLDPARVAGLALIASAGSMRVNPDLQAAADAIDPLAVRLVTGWSHTGTFRFGGHPQAGSWSAGLGAAITEHNLGSLGADLRACAAYPAIDRGPQVACPTVVVVGSADRMTPAASGEALAAVIPGCEVERVAGAGHSLMFDHPRPVVAAIGRAVDVGFHRRP